MEQLYVHSVYDTIAKHFDETRYSLWRGVRGYLNSISSGSQVLDVGCGNGKYLSYRKDCMMHGCDPCEELIRIAREKHQSANLIVANGLALPYETNSMDAVFSVAVFHHLASVETRMQFIKEFLRVWNRNERAFLSVWAYEAIRPSWKKLETEGDYIVPWHNKDDNKVYERYYHVFSKEELEGYFKGFYREITYELENWYVWF
jgi:ubiquinone/menaquinone biosynthesis C-methylase UbiE